MQGFIIDVSETDENGSEVSRLMGVGMSSDDVARLIAGRPIRIPIPQEYGPVKLIGLFFGESIEDFLSQMRGIGIINDQTVIQDSGGLLK